MSSHYNQSYASNIYLYTLHASPNKCNLTAENTTITISLLVDAVKITLSLAIYINKKPSCIVGWDSAEWLNTKIKPQIKLYR